MKGFIKYIAWNAMLVGTLALATLFELPVFVKILSVWFAIEAIVYFMVVLVPKKNLKDLYKKEGSIFKPYILVCEPLFVLTAFLLGHYGIAVCMFVTTCGYYYLYANKGGSDE